MTKRSSKRRARASPPVYILAPKIPSFNDKASYVVVWRSSYAENSLVYLISLYCLEDNLMFIH